MSDYVYAMRYDRNGCPVCGGANARDVKDLFVCEDCDYFYP